MFIILGRLYGNKDTVDERHRHRYEVNPEYVARLEAGGLKFVGQLIWNCFLFIIIYTAFSND